MRLFKIILLVGIGLMISSPVLSAGKVIPFEGQIDFESKKFDVLFNVNEGSVAAQIKKTSETNYYFSFDVKHVKTPFFDLLSKIESSVEVGPLKSNWRRNLLSEEGVSSRLSKAFDEAVLYGKIWSQYSLVDYKPIRELSGRFEVKDKRIQFSALSFGQIACQGYLDIAAPYKLDLVFKLANVQMNDFLNFWMSGNKYESEGLVSGEIKVSGTLNRPILKGGLETYNGFVHNLRYESLFLNAEGEYPYLEIARSKISQSDGMSFIFEGPINLSDTKNFKSQIKSLTLSPLINKSGSALEWTIKQSSASDEDGGGKINYFLRKDEHEKTLTERSSEMLGVERTVEF